MSVNKSNPLYPVWLMQSARACVGWGRTEEALQGSMAQKVRVPSPLCVCALHAALGFESILQQSPGPKALSEFSPAKILFISPLSLLKYALLYSARFHDFAVAVGLFAWIEMEGSGSLMLEEGW